MNRIDLNNFESGPSKIIPVKFGQNAISGLGGDVLRRNCLRTHARMDGSTTDEGQSMITKAHLHYVTGELKRKTTSICFCGFVKRKLIAKLGKFLT